MKTLNKSAISQIESSQPELSLSLGDYAYYIVREQYQSIIKLKNQVLADEDPEHLHHMRVGTRRLRTALQIFERAIVLPKAAQSKQVGSLARILGTLRDLDVQIADLKKNYYPQVPSAEQEILDTWIKRLRKQRHKAFAAVKDTLTHSHYEKLKAAYDDWLAKPVYTELAQLPLTTLLPDLLSPLLSTLLLHPGWLVATSSLSEVTNHTLHDLRKACKHARYQTEFFIPFYGEDLGTWLEEVKLLQAKLGKLQDSQVLSELLKENLTKDQDLPELRQVIQQMQDDLMVDWDSLRLKYLEADFRKHLYSLILEPAAADAKFLRKIAKPQ